jgi:proton-coupled amino acid transporter
LVGAVSSTALALLFPPISELMLAYSEDEDVNSGGKVPRALLVKDVALIILGIIGFVTGTYASLRGIILEIDQANLS